MEPSRLGNHVETIERERLKHSEHGIVFFGLADDSGVKNVGGRPGAAEGPAAFRGKFYKFHGDKFPFPVYDLGDLLPETDIESTHRVATNLIAEIHAAGHIPFILGGGHDLAFPEARAFLESHERPAFLNLDAHLDLRDTKSGITSGSPWYLLTQLPDFGKKKAELVEFGCQRHCNSSILTAYAAEKKIPIHWLDELRAKPNLLLQTYHKELQRLARKHDIQVSLDIDGVRAAEAPGCSAPQVLGFYAEEAIAMAEAAGACPAVQSFGIYELSPALDANGQTAALVAHCALGFLRGFASRQMKKKKQNR